MDNIKFKAYSSIKNVKAEGESGNGVVKFSGWASRMSDDYGNLLPDRDSELVDVEKFSLEAKVLLGHHDLKNPIGKVKLSHKPEGVWFDAEAHEYLDPKLFYGLKEGIIDSVSIGFMADSAYYREVNGEDIRVFDSGSIYELSVVSVPANKLATIQSNIDQVKSIVKDGKCIGIACSIKSLKAMNPDCGCPMSIEKTAITYDSAHPDGTPVADEDTDWDGPDEVTKADVEDLKVMCAWYDEENPDIKESYKFPHHRQEDKAVVFNALSAGMAYLDRADVPEDERKGIYDHLAKHYRDDFDKEPPEYKELEKSMKKTEVKELIEKALTFEDTEQESWNQYQLLMHNFGIFFETIEDNWFEFMWSDSLSGDEVKQNVSDAFGMFMSRVEELFDTRIGEKSLEKEKEKMIKTTETEETSPEAKDGESPAEEPKEEETQEEQPKEETATEEDQPKEEATVEETDSDNQEQPQDEPEKEPVVEEPKVEEQKPSLSPVQQVVGQLATIDINEMENESEVDALLEQVLRIHGQAEEIAEQLAEMQSN